MGEILVVIQRMGEILVVLQTIGGNFHCNANNFWEIMVVTHTMEETLVVI